MAYLLSKKFNIPYVVAIRSTDLDVFQKKLFYIRPFGRNILERAQNVILISASYKDRFLALKSLKSLKTKLEDNLCLIPNGVDPFWLENVVDKPSARSDDVFNVYI